MRNMLKSKIHRAASPTPISTMKAASLSIRNSKVQPIFVPYEQVHVLNVNNGARFTTYAIEGEEGKGEICLNGAAARLARQRRYRYHHYYTRMYVKKTFRTTNPK